MNKAGGIAYLLKHGRAPMPAVTRTTQPRRGSVSVRGYASGGAANAPLNYENVPNYEYAPAANTVAPHYELGPDGKLVFVPGTYASGIYGSGTRPAATAAAPASAPATASRDGSNGTTDVRGGGGYGGDGGLNPGHPGAYADTTSALSRAVAWGLGLTGLPSMMDAVNKAAARAGIPGYDPNAVTAKQIENAYTPPEYGNLSSTPGNTATPAGNIAANPMGLDPAQAAAARDAAAREAAGPAGMSPMGLDPAQRGAAAAEGEGRGNPGEGNQGGGYTGAGNDRDAVGGWYKNGRFNQPAYATGGITALAGGGHTQGPRLLSGGGDGLSDGIPAVIGRNQPARLADGEFVVSADVVSALGGGSTKAGAKKLYDMMDRIRKQAHGTKKQVKKVSERKVLPA